MRAAFEQRYSTFCPVLAIFFGRDRAASIFFGRKKCFRSSILGWFSGLQFLSLDKSRLMNF